MSSEGDSVTASPSCPHAEFALPWDDPGAPPPVGALRRARATLGDTFSLSSGDDDYLFLFSDEGLRSFYALAEQDASKGLADYRMLLRKLPPELFADRRTFAHDLFGAQDVEEYLGRLEVALDAELAELGAAGQFEAFGLARRVGHRLGLACWIGPEVASGPVFEALAADLDLLDGADSFVHPETVAAVRASAYTAERAALGRVEDAVAAVLVAREQDAGERGPTGQGDDHGDFLMRIAARWRDTEGAERLRGITGDVVLLHVATMTNLVAALGWTLVRVLSDESSRAAFEAGDGAAADRCALEAIRLGQRSIMMRTALADLDVDDGDTVRRVGRGTVVATMVPLTNLDAEATLREWDPARWIGRERSGPAGLGTPEQVTTFGHGSHRCPARRFSLSAIRVTLLRLFGEFELTPVFERVPEPLEHQIGGVGRAATPCPVRFDRRARITT